MRTKRRAVNPLRLLLPGVAPLLVAGCALPVGVQIATLVADGVSLMTTSKTLTDHGISAMASKDCSIWRGVTGEELCQAFPEGQGPVFVLNDEGPTASSFKSSFQIADASDVEFTAPQLRDASVTFNPPVTLAALTAEPAATETEETEDTTKDAETADNVIAEFVTASGGPSADTPAPAPTTVSTAFKVESRELPPPAIEAKPILPVAPAIHVTPVTPLIVAQPAPKPAAAPNLKPRPGTYLVVASFTRAADARTYITKKTEKKSLKAKVLPGTAKGRSVYRVAVGPVTRPDRKALRSRLTQAGFKGSWPLTLKAPRAVIELASAE